MPFPQNEEKVKFFIELINQDDIGEMLIKFYFVDGSKCQMNVNRVLEVIWNKIPDDIEA